MVKNPPSRVRTKPRTPTTKNGKFVITFNVFGTPRRLRKSANWWWVGERGILGEKRKKEIEKRNVATITRWVVIFNLLNCCCCLVACATIQFCIIIITFSWFFPHSIVVLGVTLNQKNKLLSKCIVSVSVFFFWRVSVSVY